MATSARQEIPRIAHFITGLREPAEPFHLVHYLAIASCFEVAQPTEVHVHCHRLPFGPYWDLVQPRVVVHRVEPVPEVASFVYADPDVARYRYAHHADFLRLDVLAEWGGLYADIDTLFVNPLPDACWEAPAVIGREADVTDLVSEKVTTSFSNALLLSRPGGAFVRAWREAMAGAMDGSWTAHACFLAPTMAAAMPDAVRVEPRHRFHAFEPTPAGLRRLLVDPPVSLDGSTSVHLMAHLWWEEGRRDFVDIHAGLIDERWIGEVDTTYGLAARPFLPTPATRPGRATPPAALRYLIEDGTTGYATAGRRLVGALRAARVPVQLGRWVDGVGAVVDAADGRSGVPAAGAPTVAHLVPEHLAAVRAESAGPVVVHTVWETDRIPDHWPALLNQAHGVIVPTGWNRDVFRDGGVRVPIEVVPHVAGEPTIGDDESGVGVPDDVVVFYTIARWDERKAPNLVVQAFLDAFTATDPVALVVKTGRMSEAPAPDDWGSGARLQLTPSFQVARLARHYARPPILLVAEQEWSEDRIAGLHRRGDCYVTLAHGEGWGMGSFDACAYGNPVIATGWGGHLDYLGGSDSLVDYELVSVKHKDSDSYSLSQRWAMPSLDHAVALLRAVAADPDGFRRRAEPLRDRVLRDYAAPRVAGRFVEVMTALGLPLALDRYP